LLVLPSRLVAEDVAQQLVASGIQGGLVVHLDCGDAGQTADMLLDDRFLVQGLSRDFQQVMAARDSLRARGLYGRVTVRQYDGRHLPYADNLVTAIVASGPTEVSHDELMRVLAPQGVAIVGGQRFSKAWPEGIDQWNHFLHGPDNNAVARDQVVNAPRSIQWVSGPRWGRSHEELASMSGAVTSQGRVFFIVDESPLATIRFSSNWHLVARDAFNGVLLWKRPVAPWVDHLRHFRSGPAHLSRRLVAVGDRVFVTLGLDKPVTALDGATGKTLRVYEGTEYAEEILVSDDTLYLVVGSSEVHRSGEGLFRRGEPAPTEFRYVAAVDIESGETRWQHDFGKDDFLLPLTLAVRDDRVVFQSTAGVTCLDARSGQQLWHRARRSPQRRMAFSAPTVVLADGVALVADRVVAKEEQAADGVVQWGVNGWNEEGFARRGKSMLQAYRLQDGQPLWSVPCGEGYNSPVDIFVVGDSVWVGSDFRRYDLQTGQAGEPITWKVGNVAMAHHRCYRNKATENLIFTSRAGVEVIDMQTGWVGNNSWVRGTCQYGIMPANGLLYAPPDACACVPKVKLSGFFAAAPRRDWHLPSDNLQDRLERGPAYGLPLDSNVAVSSPSADWPMYRHDGARSGSVRTELPERLERRWTARIGGQLTQPVSQDGRIYVASVDNHTLFALDAESGQQLWTFTAGGRIDSSPTLHESLVYFGCADGHVYACRARDGALVWRFRTAPLDLQICAFGQLESVWPSHGSVLMQNDALYVTAGRSTYLDGGIVLFRLNPVTGEPLTRTVVTHIDPQTDQQTGAEDRKKYGFDMEGATTDVLSGDGESVFLKHLHFNSDGQEMRRDKPHLFSITGFLVEDWFVRTYWLLGTDVQAGWGGWAKAANTALSGRLLCFNDEFVFGYGRKAIEGGRTGHRANDYYLFCGRRSQETTPADAVRRRTKRGRPVEKSIIWTDDQSIIARAMVLAGDKLVVAGPPSLKPYKSNPMRFANEAEALATFRGERGVQLQVRSLTDGSVLSNLRLEAMPAFDGMSAAGGQLLISLKNGSVVCYGQN
jgi:outer membrane protein assembly factor BamB